MNDKHRDTAPNEEVARLRQQIATMEQEMQQLRGVIDNARAAVFVKDQSGHYLLSNREFDGLFHLEPGEVVGKTDTYLLPPDLADQVGQNDRKVLAARQSQEHEEQVMVDGKIRTYLSHKFPLYDEQGTAYATGGIATDITERKQVEEELRESERRLRSMFENATIGMYRTTPEGRFVAVNPAMAHILSYDSPEELMQTITSIGEQLYADAQCRQEIVRRLQETQGTVQAEVDFLRKDGSRITVSLAAWVTRDERGTASFIEGFVEDITERKRAEQERTALQEQIIAAQQQTLRQLSTPLIPIADNVVIMPLIGTLDSQRAQQVLESLLEGVARYQADLAILDITGVEVVDTQVAQGLIQAARSVRLLGAQVMLTGIQPQIAQTLVHLGVDFQSIITRGSLKEGIAFALKQMQNGTPQ